MYSVRVQTSRQRANNIVARASPAVAPLTTTILAHITDWGLLK